MKTTWAHHTYPQAKACVVGNLTLQGSRSLVTLASGQVRCLARPSTTARARAFSFSSFFLKKTTPQKRKNTQAARDPALPSTLPDVVGEITSLFFSPRCHDCC